MASEKEQLIKKFIKQFNAQVVIPYDGKICQLDIGHNRITISNSVKSLPPGTEFMLRPRYLLQILERDVWDVPLLLEAALIEEQFKRSMPTGSFRPKGGKPKVIYPSGIPSIDTALYGGFLGRIISRVWGASEGGKSVILYMTMITAWALFRKRSLLINPEFDFDEDRVRVLPGGDDLLDNDALEVYEPGTGTDAYDEALDKIAGGGFGVAGIDSISPLKAAEEMNKALRDVEKVAAKATIQNRFLDSLMPLLYHQSNTAFIVVVQGRRKIMVGKGSQGHFDSVSGTYSKDGAKPASSDALQFDAQQSIRVNAASNPKFESGNMIGHLCTGFVDKNKRAPKGRTFEFYIDYHEGLFLEDQIAEAAIKEGIIKLKGTTHKLPDGTKYKTGKVFREALREDSALRKSIYVEILKSFNPSIRL